METKNSDLANLIEGFKLSCQTEGKSPSTIEWYGTFFLLRFAQFLGMEGLTTLVTQIDRSHLRSFICHLQTAAKMPHSGAPLSAATVQGYVRTLKAFFSWLEKEEYLVANPIARLPVPSLKVAISAHPVRVPIASSRYFFASLVRMK